MLNGRVLLFWVRGRRLEITPALLTMPLLSNLPAGSAHERHRHGAAHGTDLFGVCGLTVRTNDTFAAVEVLLSLDFCTQFVHLFLCL